jgi:hypothetical protein
MTGLAGLAAAILFYLAVAVLLVGFAIISDAVYRRFH